MAPEHRLFLAITLSFLIQAARDGILNRNGGPGLPVARSETGHSLELTFENRPTSSKQASAAERTSACFLAAARSLAFVFRPDVQVSNESIPSRTGVFFSDRWNISGDKSESGAGIAPISRAGGYTLLDTSRAGQDKSAVQ